MSGEEKVFYRIIAGNPDAHLFEVRCRIERPTAGGQTVSLPAWIPGSYMIRDFAKNLVSVCALCGEEHLAISKLDKQTWLCAPAEGPIEIICQVYAWELSVRSAHLDRTHAYFNGTSVFLRVHGKESLPCDVAMLCPEGPEYARWELATAMPRVDVDARGFGLYRASNYADLIDHPVEIGRFSRARFEVCGVQHEVVISGRHRADMERLSGDLGRVCAHHAGMFGGDLPLDRYLFLVMATEDGYGGLEHCASTSLLCSRRDLPQPGQAPVSEGYRRFLGLCSHEYFHLWNVKRIRPSVFMTDDLSQEVYTSLLWAFEGITSYYDDLALIRCGLIDADSYLELLARNITRLSRVGGRFRQTVSESSFDAWTKFYKQDENAPNAIVSYYVKGSLVALCLDLTIRLASDGVRSLDDVMHALWHRYGRLGLGVDEDGVERIAAEATGLELQSFFDQALRSTDELPVEQLLSAFGVGFRMRPARDSEDEGGLAAAPAVQAPSLRAGIGVKLDPQRSEAVLLHVYDNGGAQRAGLAPGDTLVAIDGLRVNRNNFEKLMESLQAGSAVSVHAFRRDELMAFDLIPLSAPDDTCDLWLLEDVDEQQTARRSAWLDRKTHSDRSGDSG